MRFRQALQSSSNYVRRGLRACMLPRGVQGVKWTWDAFLHVLLPRTCFCCKRDLPFRAEDPLCAACMDSLQIPGPLFCVRCGVTLKDGGAHCRRCRGSKAGEFACKIIRSSFAFNPPVRALVHALKYGGHAYLARFMGKQMVREYARYPELKDASVLCPVPLHRKKLKARGYNQSALLAEELAKGLGLVYAADWVERARNTPSQTGLNREGRLENMKGAFTCRAPERVKGKVVLLIDDVATTGATLEGCAEALRQAGAKKVLAYTYSRE